MLKKIRVSEFEKLYYSESKPFRKEHWEKLCKYVEKESAISQITCFKIIHKGIHFTNFVGVIQVGDLTIEILPKLDKNFSTASNETIENLTGVERTSKGMWRDVLLQMLIECDILDIKQVGYANLNLHSDSILEIYITLFLDQAEGLLHEGLLKKYDEYEGNSLSLKGSLMFSKQVAFNASRQERFYVRSTRYTTDNIYNQIVFEALLLTQSIGIKNHLKERITKLLSKYPEISRHRITAETFTRIQYNRKTERYREAHLISKMLLLKFRPSLTGGKDNVIAIVFDMNQLWEEFVYLRLKKAEGQFKIKVQKKGTLDFWAAEHLKRPRKIHPDIIIKKGHKTVIVDTKWKSLDSGIPDDGDLKQMFVYNLFWQCETSYLLYPANEDWFKLGTYSNFDLLGDSVYSCGIIGQSIINRGKILDKALGSKILSTIFGSSQD